MADAKISTLPASTNPLAGTEVLPIVQSGSTKQVSVANLTTGRAISVSGLTNTALTSGRITYATTGGQLTDNSGLTYGVDNVTLSYSGATRIQIVNSTGGNNVLLTAGASNAVLNSANGYQWELQTASSTKLTVDNSSNVTVNLGNLVIGTSGKGIDFSASGQAAGMTSELLDDYEEGTWTPNLSGDEVLTGATGVYTKIGRQVTVSFTYTVTTIGTGSTQTISGLPFTSNAVLYAGSVAYFANSVTSVTSIILRTNFSSTTLQIVALTAAGTTAESVDINQNGTVFYGTITYFV
jgi:hypothetical protein